MTNDVYVLYEVDYDDSNILGVFTTKEEAETYLQNYMLSNGNALYSDHSFLTICKESLNPKNEIPNRIKVFGYASIDDNGEIHLEQCEYSNDTELCFDAPVFKSEYDDKEYYFEFFLDVSGIDKNTSMKDYYEYIKQEAKKHIVQDLNKE